MTEEYPFAFTIEAFSREHELEDIDRHFIDTIKASMSHYQLLNRLQGETQIRSSAMLGALQASLRAYFIISFFADMLCFYDAADYLRQSPAFLRSNKGIRDTMDFFYYIYQIRVLYGVNLKPLFNYANFGTFLQEINSRQQDLSFAAPTPIYALRSLESAFGRVQADILRQLTNQVGGSLEQILENDYKTAFRTGDAELKLEPKGEFAPQRYFNGIEASESVTCYELCRICFHLTDVEIARLRFLLDAIRVVAHFWRQMQAGTQRTHKELLFAFEIRQVLQKMLFYFEFVCSQRLSINETFSRIFAYVYQYKHFIKICDILMACAQPLRTQQLVALRTELRCVIEDFRRAGAECGCYSWL